MTINIETSTPHLVRLTLKRRQWHLTVTNVTVQRTSTIPLLDEEVVALLQAIIQRKRPFIYLAILERLALSMDCPFIVFDFLP